MTPLISSSQGGDGANIAIVGQQQLVLEGLSALIQTSGKFGKSAVFNSISTYLNAVTASCKADVLMIDVCQHGLDILADLPAHLTSPVVAMTHSKDAIMAQQCAQAGVVGIIHRDSPPEHLLDMLTQAAEGELHASVPRPTTVSYQWLTPREHNLATALVAGKTNKDIASEQHLAPGTVRNYLTILFDKLGVSTRAEAVVRLRESGLF